MIGKHDVYASLKVAIFALLDLGEIPDEIIRNLSRFFDEYLDTKRRVRLPHTNTSIYRIHGPVEFDITLRRIRYHNYQIELTPNEAKLFMKFIENPGVMHDMDSIALLFDADPSSPEYPAGYVRPLISRLRTKLGKIPGGDKWIVSIRGDGYVLEFPKDL